jgi:hypothetical protein
MSGHHRRSRERVVSAKDCSRVDTCWVSQTERTYEPSVGAVYAFIGIVLIVLGGVALSNANEADTFGIIGMGLIAGGSYATIAGAVARGIQLARK